VFGREDDDRKFPFTVPVPEEFVQAGGQ
jgi:hypothetical protein